jgi:protein disulfide-isomerase A6
MNFAGATKLEPLTELLNSILDGTADLGTTSEETKASDRPDDEL